MPSDAVVAPIHPPPPGPVKQRWTVARLSRLMIIIAGLPCLAIVVAAGVSSCLDKKRDLVVFDSLLDTPAEVAIDGKVVETIKPRSSFWIHPVVKLPEGAKEIEVRANGNLVSKATLAIRPRGKDDRGYRGLYVIGPPRDYVIAKVPYYAEARDDAEPPRLVRLPTPRPLAELPRELRAYEMSKIDGPFSRSESMPTGAKMIWKTQLCTIDDAKEPPAIGCSGFPR